MIRQSVIDLNYANAGKKGILLSFLNEYALTVNKYIDLLWEVRQFSGSWLTKDQVARVSSNLTPTAKQACSSQALRIVKTQRKQRTGTKPVFKGTSFELDQRFIKIEDGRGSFDLCVGIGCLGLGKFVTFPSKKHAHFNKFVDDGWRLKNSARIRVTPSGKIRMYVFFEKASPPLKTDGADVGLDCGYKKLAVLSDGRVVGRDLERKIEKIATRRQGSKAFKRALTERNDYINHEVKQIGLGGLRTLVVEDLRLVTHGTRGKIRRQFMNKLQRWVYARLLKRLEMTCEVGGVHFHKVNPAYTSQTCSNCGDVRKENRIGEVFRCRSCGYTTDADFNASRNILNRFTPPEPTDPVQGGYADALATA